LKQRLNLFYHTYLLIVAANAGVKRQIAMSNGYELARNPEAISDLIRDEQIKVMGCRFAICEYLIVVTPALTNMERSGMLVNG
jgi:hypothetical protein